MRLGAKRPQSMKLRPAARSVRHVTRAGPAQLRDRLAQREEAFERQVLKELDPRAALAQILDRHSEAGDASQ